MSFLPDIEPGVEYRYVVQGTTADGTLYRSPVGYVPHRGAAPRRAATVDRGDDLALGATVVDVSSEFAADFAAELAIDGDTSTEWATHSDGDDGFITIDLGAEHRLTGVEFVTRSMADGTARTGTFTVTVDDGETSGPFPRPPSPSRTSPRSTPPAGGCASTSPTRPAATSALSRSASTATRPEPLTPAIRGPRRCGRALHGARVRAPARGAGLRAGGGRRPRRRARPGVRPGARRADDGIRGRRGLDIGIAPSDLITVLAAIVAAITV